MTGKRRTVVTAASLLASLTNDYSDLERQFEGRGGVFVDFGKDSLAKFPPGERERKKKERDVLLKGFLRAEEHVPKLAIVVNVAGRPRVFPDVLKSLARQSFVREHPAFVEVMLVQDGPQGVLDHAIRGDLLEALAEFPHKTKVRGFRLGGDREQRGRGTARNVGVSHAHSGTKVVMFLDDAMILDRDFVAEQMLRHASIAAPIALLGFKANRMFEDFDEYTRQRDQMLSGRPTFEEDWKWSHCLKEDEVTIGGVQGIEYQGQRFTSLSIIHYMEITNNLKALRGDQPIGHRWLPVFFHTGLTSVTYASVRDVGGFEPMFDVDVWGFEDSYLGLLLAVKGVKLVPCPSSVAYKIEFKHEEGVKDKAFDIALHRQTFWECADNSWNSYNQSKLRRQIEKLKSQGLLEPVTLERPGKKSRAGRGIQVTFEDKRSALRSPSPFQIVDQAYLGKQLEHPIAPFVARPPEWKDVVRGQDANVHFVEREDTERLEREVTEKLLVPLKTGLDRYLRVLFVVGAPGSGKSTLAMRVAARLVLKGQALVADAGPSEPCAEAEEYVQRLEHLGAAGRPILLLLDDPLRVESEWINVLRVLNRPGSRTAVLAACPTYLFDHFKSELPKGVQVFTYPLQRPTRKDRIQLARVNGLEETLFLNRDDEFLVLAWEAAADIPFDNIIERTWDVLNDGRPIAVGTLGELPAPVRAYTVTCFFARAGISCRWPLLESFVRLTSSPTTPDLTEALLRRLRTAEGWAIFRIIEPPPSFEHLGLGIEAAHQNVAARAWQLRPLRSEPIERWVIQACTETSVVARSAAQLTVWLWERKEPGDRDFVEWLITAWVEAGMLIDTRNLFTIGGVLTSLKVAPSSMNRLDEALRQRAVPSRDGWLAALYLWQRSESGAIPTAIPDALDMPGIIRAADFSLATFRAAAFLKRANSKPSLRRIVIARLVQGLNRELDWELPSMLLTWLLASADVSDLTPHFGRITEWLKSHPDNSEVRARFLGFVEKLPKGSPVDFSEVVTTYTKWLKSHPDNSEVRTRFLGFVERLPKGSPVDLSEVVTTYTKWLKSHPDNSEVRTRFLGFVEKLPKGSPIDLSEVVTTYTEWLKSHPADTNVRSNFPGFLRSLHGDDERITEAIRGGISEMARWLRDVALPSLHDRTDQSLIETVGMCMEAIAEYATTGTALEILSAAVEMVEHVALTDRTAPLVGWLTGLYHRAMRVTQPEKLNSIRAAILEWCDTNPSASRCSPWLPVPS